MDQILYGLGCINYQYLCNPNPRSIAAATAFLHSPAATTSVEVPNHQSQSPRAHPPPGNQMAYVAAAAPRPTTLVPSRLVVDVQLWRSKANDSGGLYGRGKERSNQLLLDLNVIVTAMQCFADDDVVADRPPLLPPFYAITVVVRHQVTTTVVRWWLAPPTTVCRNRMTDNQRNQLVTAMRWWLPPHAPFCHHHRPLWVQLNTQSRSIFTAVKVFGCDLNLINFLRKTDIDR
ncbi:unnamed protein product [Lactuca saligna]|uniref:Uncharacterized protein n=1 Tax=Lactuca saligna TaxID=75948 RepID=A0AA35ZQE0_LACSI|nr:unnamed protein product [Lactuca saligna]